MRRSVLIFLGLYYAIFGIWAIVDIQNFSLFTQHQGGYFLKYTNAVLFLSLGLLFLWYSLKNMIVQPIILVAILATLGIAIVDFFYIPKIGSPFPFLVDFGIEIICGIILVISLIQDNLRKQSK